MLQLDAGADKWAREILAVNTTRMKDAKVQLIKKGYDIKTEAKQLAQWYIRLYKETTENVRVERNDTGNECSNDRT